MEVTDEIKPGYGRKWKKLDKAIYAVGDPKIVYFRIMVNGKRETLKSPIQGAAAIGPNGKPTNELKKLALNWRYKLMNKDYYDGQDRKHAVPSFAKLLELYQDAAAAEQIKSGRPEARTIATAVKYFRYLVEGCGFKWTEPMSRLRTEDIDGFIVKTIKAGKTPTSAWTYASSCQSVTPRWALEYYSREGYDVRQYQMPVFRNRKPPRYERPTKATLAAIDEWYKKLWKDGKTTSGQQQANGMGKPDGRARAGKTTSGQQQANGMSKKDCRIWFLATMMYKFAMRNGDVGRLTMNNFAEHDGSFYLVYTPHKTANSSGTVVNWPVHPDLFARFKRVQERLGIDDDEHFLSSCRETSSAVNHMLREIPGLAEKEKASYELRKMCVDHVYHDFGVEMAAAISGDDIKTLTYFYADVSHVKASAALVANQV